MAEMTITDLPDRVKERLRRAAAKSGISLEMYARKILQEAARGGGGQSVNLGDLAKECFGTKGGVDLELPLRSSRREASACSE